MDSDSSQGPSTPNLSMNSGMAPVPQPLSIPQINRPENMPPPSVASSENQPPNAPPIEEVPLSPRDLLMDLEQCVQSVQADHYSDEDKKAAVEKLRASVEDYFLLDCIGEAAKASVQMFTHIFSRTNPVSSESPLFSLRKYLLELVIRFVPADGYKCHTRLLEDVMCRQLVIEYEANAVLMLKYICDCSRQGRAANVNNLVLLISELRTNVDCIIEYVRQDTEHRMFVRKTFSSTQLQDYEYMQTVLSNLYFENLVKMIKAPPLLLLPPAKNSIKLILEFTNMVSALLHLAKEKMTAIMPDIIGTFANFIILEIDTSNDQVHPENAAIFHEVQLRMLCFMSYQFKKNDYNAIASVNFAHIVSHFTRNLVTSIRLLLRNLSPLSMNYRKDLLDLVKMLFVSDIRRELLDIVPDLCYEEHISGPSCMMPATLRSGLFCSNFDAMHNVRTMLDWTTFQHVFVMILRTSMDYTLLPNIQGVSWKAMLNLLDACQKAEEAVYPQLTVGFNYDSARMLYQNAFFAICQKFNTIVVDNVKPVLDNVANQNLKSGDGKHKPPVEIYTEGQSSDDDSDADSLGSEYERKPNVFDELNPTAELNSDQEEVVDEVFTSTTGELDDDGRIIVDGQSVLENLKLPTKAYPLRPAKRFRRNREGKKYVLNFQHGPGLESAPASDESDNDDGQKQGYYEMQKTFYKKNPDAFYTHTKRREELEANISDSASELSFEEKVHEFAMNCFDRGDLRMRLRRFEEEAKKRPAPKILPLTRPETNFQHEIYGYEDVFPRQGKFDSDSSSVQMQPERFPYSLPDLRLLLRNMALSLKVLMSACHIEDDLKAQEPPPQIVQAMSDLVKNFILSLDLFTIVPVGSNFGFSHQPIMNPEDKEYLDAFTAIFHNMHPAVFERILRQHMPLFFESSLRNGYIGHVFANIIGFIPLQTSVSHVLVDFVMENPHYAYEMDEDDTWRYGIYQRILKVALHCISHQLAAPQPFGFEKKIQKFFYDFALLCIQKSLSLTEPTVPITLLRTLFRQCGNCPGEPLYQTFLPLFPSFLQWMSGGQNLVTNDSTQDNFIEMCLSLPTRLSSLVPFMPMISESIVNSFISSMNQLQNNVPPNPQGWRTLELCLDNYYTGNIKDFLGPGLARVVECLYKCVANVDTSQMAHILKMISRLSGLNRGTVNDVQRLTGRCSLDLASPLLKVHFERSGKQVDSIITDCYQLNELHEAPANNEVYYLNQGRESLFVIDPVTPATEPLTISIPLQAAVNQCLNILKTANTAEGHVQRTFSVTGRAEAAYLLLHLAKLTFNPELDAADANAHSLKIAMLNYRIVTEAEKVEPTWAHPKRYQRPWRCADATFRQFHVQVLCGLLYASVNPDYKPLIEPFWEDMVDMLTTLAHLETGLGQELCQTFHPVFATSTMDAFVIVDVVLATIQDKASPRFLSTAVNTVMRMIQTALSFAPNRDIALNIPLFHHLLAEVCALCTRPELHTRIGAIVVLEHLIEEMPLCFLHAAFGRMLEAVFDVLHFGDDDYSESCIENAVRAGEKLLDRVLGVNEIFPDDVDDTDSDDDSDVDEEVAEDTDAPMPEDTQDAENVETTDVKNVKKIVVDVEPLNRVPEFILVGLKQEVIKRISTSSFPVADYLCKIIAALSTTNKDVAEAMFTRAEVTEIFGDLIDIFFTTNFQHRFIGIKLAKYLITALQDYEYIDALVLKRLPEYVKVLAYQLQTRDEDVVTGAIYLTYHLQLPPGAHPPPSSTTTRWNNGMHFIERLKAFREELPSFMAVLTVHLAQSIALKQVSVVPMPFNMPNMLLVPDMVNLMFSANVKCAMLSSAERQTASIKAVEQTLFELEYTDKPKLIQEIVNNVAPCTRIDQIHFLASLVTSPEDFSTQQLYQILNNTENFLVNLANVVNYGPIEVKFFESFMNICLRAKVPVNDTFLEHIFLFLSRNQIINAFTLGMADFFSPVARFLGALPCDEEISFEWFTAFDRIQQESYRAVFKILAAHPHSKDLLAMWLKYDTKIADLLLHHVIQTPDSSVRIPATSYLDIDYMMIHLIMQFCDAFPHYFATVSRFPKLIIRFMLSRHFRGNYALQHHGLDDNDSLKLSSFITTKATVPEFCTNMIIHALTINPYEFNFLLCVCSTLPQVYFNETTTLRNFIDNFLVPRMTLRWRRALLHFINEKLNDLFTETMPTETEGKNFCEFMQVALGNLMNYVLYPAYSYAFDRFVAALVLDGSNDDVLEAEDNWQEVLEKRTVTAVDMAKEFCLKSLSLYNEKNYLIRPELAHGILQFSILLMQRASAHIHEPGMTVQSNDLQNVMQAAWPATSGGGVFTDKWLRAIGLYLLACVMSAVTIKKDIIMQLYDTVVAMPDARDNAILQKTMYVLSCHAVRRKDDCFTFFVDRIRTKLLEDGFNAVKIGNTLSMLANNYEDFFPARYMLSVTILFTVNRLINLKNAFPLLHDAVKTIIGWEEMRVDKVNLFKNHSTDEKIARLLSDPAMKPLEPALLEQTASLVIKLSFTNDQKQVKKMTPIFHKALHPRVVGRNMFSKFDKTLMPRDYELNSVQYNNMINQIMMMTKSLMHYLSTAPISNVYCFTVALQQVPKAVISTNHGALMDTMVTFVTRLLEMCREAEPNDRHSVRDFILPDKRFMPLFTALAEYTFKVSIRFAARTTSDFSGLTVLLNMLKSVTGNSDQAYKMLIGPEVINIGSRMANEFVPSYNTEVDRYKHDLIITLLEVFTAKAELLSPEYTSLFLHNVVYKILTRHENLPAKYHDPICKFLNASINKVIPGDSKLSNVSRQHMSVIGAIARHHTHTLIKYPTLLGFFLNTVATLFREGSEFSSDFTEIWLAYFTGLSSSEVEIREKFLDIFEMKLPNTFFERLIHLFTAETWSFMPGNTFIAVIVNMLFRCVLKNGGPRPIAASPDDETSPQRVVPDKAPVAVFVEPVYSYRAPVNGIGLETSMVVDVNDIWPKPAAGGTFPFADVKYDSKHLEQICSNYVYHINNAKTQLNRGFNDFIDSFLKINHEGDTCLAIFEDLVPSIWKVLTKDERELFTEATAQFMVMPVFNTCPANVAHAVWNAVTRCEPPMPIDFTKIMSSLSGVKFTTHALVRYEEQIPRTVNLHTHIWEMRRMYSLLKDDDQLAVTWQNFSLSESAYRAFALHCVGDHSGAISAIKEAQREYRAAIGPGEQVIDDEKCAYKADFDLLTELGNKVLKESSRWKDVFQAASKDEDMILGVEALFQLWQSTDDWQEIMSLCKLTKDTDCPREMFFSISLGLVASLYRSTSDLEQVLLTESFEERLRNVLTERLRRLPLYYGPDYVEVYSDITIFADLFELINVMKELYSSEPARFNKTLETGVKALISKWRLRSCSPSDPPDVASRYYQFRLTFLWILNNAIQKIRPDFRSVYNHQYNMTPAYHLAETACWKFKSLCVFGDYRAARESLQRMNTIGYINSLDACSMMCNSIRALIKQYQLQPQTLTLDEAVNEIVNFRNVDLSFFGPDSVAMYAVTLSYVNDALGWKERAQVNLRTALSLEMEIKDIPMVHPERVMKSLAGSEHQKFMNTPTKQTATNAFEALLMSLNKNFVKNHRHVARGIWALKNPILMSPDWLSALIPQVPSVNFLPFIENIINEVVMNQRAYVAYIACFIGQVYPFHVLHQLYRQMNPAHFAAVIRTGRVRMNFNSEYQRFRVEGITESLSDSDVFVTKPDLLSEREGTKGRLVTVFRDMLPKLLNNNNVDKALLTALFMYQPADVRAYVEVLDALDNIKQLPLETVLNGVYAVYDVVVSIAYDYIYNDRPNASADVMSALEECYTAIIDHLRDAPDHLFSFQTATDIDDPPTLSQQLRHFAKFIMDLEEYVTEELNPIPLAEVAPTLYNFTLARAKIPDFTVQHDPVYGQCFPVIENFASRMRFVAKNMSCWKELDVRLSNGRVITYRITSHRSDVSTNGISLMSLLNAPLEKSFDTMKRGATFRVPHAVPLRKVTLLEVQNKPVNQLTPKPPHVISLTDIYCAPQPKRGLAATHPAKLMAAYFDSIISKLDQVPDDDSMEVDNAPLDRASAISAGIREFTDSQCRDRIRSWFINYFNDLATFAHVRKQIATQLGTFSALHWVTQGSPITMDDILIDLDYGKVWFQNYHFTGKSWTPDVRRKLILSPQLAEFLGDTVHGHFAMAAVTVAKSLLRRGYEDYVRPLIADLAVVRQSKNLTIFNTVNKIVDTHLEKLKALANFNALPDDTIKLLINQSLEQDAFELKQTETRLFM